MVIIMVKRIILMYLQDAGPVPQMRLISVVFVIPTYTEIEIFIALTMET
jgi:hypothetical protein